MMEKTNDLFVKNLIRLRKSLNLNQADIAEKIGVNLTTYQKYEYGKAFPRPAKVEAIAAALGVSVSDMYSEATVGRSNDLIETYSSIIAGLASLDEPQLRAVLGFIDDLRAFQTQTSRTHGAKLK